jgi:hypothetical protein
LSWHSEDYRPHDPRMGTNHRRLNMLEQRARHTISEVAEPFKGYRSFCLPAGIVSIAILPIGRFDGGKVTDVILWQDLVLCVR